MGRPRSKPADRILVAKATGIWVSPEGDEYWAHAGITRITADHPFARATPDWWEEIESHFPSVEQATAAPGELRDDEEAA